MGKGCPGFAEQQFSGHSQVNEEGVVSEEFEEKALPVAENPFDDLP